jgi:hypothetical protein
MADTPSLHAMGNVHAALGLTTSSSSPPTPIPDAILAENSSHYIICFQPDDAGVITTSPHAATKDFLATAYPEIVEAWNRKTKDNWDAALQIEQSMTDYAVFFRGKQCAQELARKDPGVACDQKLLAGMRRHWGELRQCTKHLRQRGDFLVCKGCRVAHHAQPERDFDRNVLMTEGARVPVCGVCAKRSVLDLGAGYRGCVCDRDWTCFRCRENVLEKLAKTRSRLHVEGKCGMCDGMEDVVRYVEVCLLCRGVVVYNKPA